MRFTVWPVPRRTYSAAWSTSSPHPRFAANPRRKSSSPGVRIIPGETLLTVTPELELPLPASFNAASTTVRKEDVSTQMPCGPDLQQYVAGIRAFENAGFTHLALAQI